MKNLLLYVLSILIVLSVLAGCAGSSYAPAAPQSAPAAYEAHDDVELWSSDAGGMTGSEAAAAAGDYDMAANDSVYEIAMHPGPEPLPPDEGIAGPEVETVLDARKIIKNARLTIQTVSFDSGIEYISGAVGRFGGFIERSSVSGRDMYSERGMRTASFTIRVPAENLDAFVGSLGGNDFNIISNEQYVDDITERYYDSQARLNSLRIQEERLLSMLEGATDLETLLLVEKELMNVRYEIESLTSALRRMDNSVRLSTVDISLFEVVKYEPVRDVPVTFGERISRAFSDSVTSFTAFTQGFIVFIVATFPFLILLGLIVFIIVFCVRRSGKKRAAKMLDYQNRQLATYMAQQPQQTEAAQDGNEPK